MVTLATLSQSSAQQVFDHITGHLLTQRRQSLLGGKCAYQGIDGLKCAAGCLFDAGEYNLNFEGETWGQLVKDKLVPSEHEDIITALQAVHDWYGPEDWELQLKNVAIKFHLDWKFEPPMAMPLDHLYEGGL